MGIGCTLLAYVVPVLLRGCRVIGLGIVLFKFRVPACSQPASPWNSTTGLAWDGVTCTGSHPLLIKVGKHGAVDQMEVSKASQEYCSCVCAWLDGCAGRSKCVAGLLVAFCEGGKLMRAAYFQLAWAVASTLEQALAAKAGEVTDHAKLKPGKKARTSALALAQAKHMAESRDRRLHQYFYACHAAFAQHQHLGLTLDFSRAGHRKMGVGCISSLDNVVAWCPPQALRDIAF